MKKVDKMGAADNVYKNLGAIINYCNNIEHSELEKLLDINYSKKEFDINFPFFIDVNDVDESNNKKQSKRFLVKMYIVRNIRVRVTSQWTYDNIAYFKRYLEKKNIKPNFEINDALNNNTTSGNDGRKIIPRNNSRYRGNAIGNAQNLVIRNILSNLGNESFNETDWLKTKEYFKNKCAYCGSDGEMVMEHAIPINKEKLGEHKIGNIIPSCQKCNSEKADKDYKEFLGENIDKIKKIEAYMDEKNYVPLENNNQLKKILNMAYEEIALVANRYIDIINELFIQE